MLLVSYLFYVCSSKVKENDFINWKLMNTKVYVDKAAENEALGNFVANKRAIDENNMKYAKGEVSFARAVNKYSDWSLERKRRWLNGFVSNKTTKQAYEDYMGLAKDSEKEVEIRTELPEFVDWRTLGYVSPVQDQGM